jgi:hypothetical protein
VDRLVARLFANSLNPVLIALVVLCGFAAFATLEILKRVFGLRGFYQLRQTQVWLTRRYARDDAFDGMLKAMGLHTAKGGLAWDERHRVFNLPTEHLAAQISAAADLALTAPSTSSRESDVATTVARDPGVPFLAALTGLSDKKVEEELGRPPYDPDYQARQPELAARVRLGIDQLQISLSERWRRYVQGAALWISGAYGIGLAHSALVPRHLALRPGAIVPSELAYQPAEARYVLAALLVGGVFAWIARDIVAVIERARR